MVFGRVLPIQVDVRCLTILFFDAKPARELDIVGGVSLVTHLDPGVAALVHDTPRSVSFVAPRCPSDPILISFHPHERAIHSLIVWLFHV